MEEVDVVVIGAGVVGLATGRALARAGREVLVLERHDLIGSETSSRNSEVIHAGIYYRPGGLRAQLCPQGREALYDFCKDYHVPHERCGKLIVAHGAEETAALDALIKTAAANGVDDLERLSGAEACALEPALACDAAILSPSSGIIDSHSLMVALQGDLEAHGGAAVLSSPVLSGAMEEGQCVLQIGGPAPMALRARLVVNCAGLYADKTARAIKGLPAETIPTIRPGKGQYFIYSGKAPFERLIYPMHTKDSQGVHYSRDLGGQARLGPDITWDAALGDYSVDESRLDYFFTAARRFWPGLERDRLTPGYAGQRPKIAGPGEEGDFQIQGAERHGARAYIGLYGIESPGLTSCLAIADYTAAIAAKQP